MPAGGPDRIAREPPREGLMSDALVRIADQEFAVAVRREGEGWKAEVAGAEPQSIHMRRLADNQAELVLDGKRHVVWFVLIEDTLHFHFEGTTYAAELIPAASRKRTRHREHSLAAPMPGVVLKIFVSAGDVVSKGDPVLVLEAMKMEHQVTAPYDGLVEQIHCQAGELVQPGFELISLKEHKKP